MVACEESQEVCMAFRELGHEAYSCDLVDCSGGHPEWHIKSDVLKLIRGKCSFETLDNQTHRIDGKWDIIIAHPPCTYLSNAGACRLFPKKGELNKDRYIDGLKGKSFFMTLFLYGWYGYGRIAIENPIPSKIYELPKHTQVIQPYEFGHPFTKKTYLWLFGLPPIMPTEIVEPVGPYVCGNAEIWKKQAQKGIVYGKEKSSRHRSKTFSGVAKAMAEQWSDFVLSQMLD